MSRRLPVILGCSLLLLGCGKPPPQKMPPAMVGVMLVKEQPVTLTADLPGRTSPFEVAEIRPQVSGIIQKRLFVEGSAVKAGQALYQIDPAPYQAAYDAAAATLASARSLAQRYKTLLAQNAIAPQQNDNAQSAYLQAKAAAESARINLAYTRITAPIAGRISASAVTAGALVTANQPTALATISTLDPIYVDIDQSSAELIALRRAVEKGRLQQGGALAAQVTLALDDGSAYRHPGTLQFTDVTVDQATGAVRLRALFPNPEGLLLPGLYVRATINEGTDPHGILVPQNAVSRDQRGEPTALVADAKNIARLRMLKTGRAIAGQWQVLEGLKPGDRLIVQGLQRAVPDQPVTVVATLPAPPATNGH